MIGLKIDPPSNALLEGARGRVNAWVAQREVDRKTFSLLPSVHPSPFLFLLLCLRLRAFSQLALSNDLNLKAKHLYADTSRSTGTLEFFFGLGESKQIGTLQERDYVKRTCRLILSSFRLEILTLLRGSFIVVGIEIATPSII